MNERLIRFDIRLPKDRYVEEYWDESSRKDYLLRPEIEWPISVDPLVWPSLFFSRIFRDSSASPYGDIEVDPNVNDGNYWLNLAEMKSYYEDHKLSNTNGIFVCIHLLSELSLNENRVPYLAPGGIECALVLEATIPRECPTGSEFLGYDVADASWLSALTNCKYASDEKRQLAPKWISRLNALGLLTTLEDAIEFRRLSDMRVPEHAPFWIYSIRRLVV